MACIFIIMHIIVVNMVKINLHFINKYSFESAFVVGLPKDKVIKSVWPSMWYKLFQDLLSEFWNLSPESAADYKDWYRMYGRNVIQCKYQKKNGTL